ncbi:MAG: hypothetical protein H6Q90_4350 [Deltaproteobacteria bacterium]|nr:hypothetical protein [Deltaproteobacteria bacterium]
MVLIHATNRAGGLGLTAVASFIMDTIQAHEWWEYGALGFVALVLSFGIWFCFLFRRYHKQLKRNEEERAAWAVEREQLRAKAEARHPDVVETPAETAPQQHVVILAGEAHRSLLAAALPTPFVFVNNRAELVAAAKDKPAVVAFVDVDLLSHFGGGLTGVPIIGIVDGSPSEALPRTIRAFDSHPWLSHVVAETMLSSPVARPQLTALLARLACGPTREMLGAAGVGRVALLAQASRREARFERISEFFSRQGLSARTISAIGEVSEELVMNALYDAPVEAGYFKDAIPRTEDVDLPPERACEISYGMEAGNIFVRLRDTFGALTRARMLDVLNRCNAKGVALDESRGGAGLGLWRVFSLASTICITVIPGQVTDIVIGIAPKEGRVAKQLLAVNLFFVPASDDDFDSLIPGDDQDWLDQSVSLPTNS